VHPDGDNKEKRWIIYKTTFFPSNKIYVGQDRTDDRKYLGSPTDLKRICAENLPEHFEPRTPR